MSTTVHPSIYRNLQVATGHVTKLLLKTGKINLMAHDLGLAITGYETCFKS